MNRKVIIIEIAVMVLLFVSVFVGGVAYTGSVIKNARSVGVDDGRFDYIYTTAICDGNKCRDFEIICKNGEAIRTDPISGMVIFPSDWEDRREQDRELCDR